MDVAGMLNDCCATMGNRGAVQAREVFIKMVARVQIAAPSRA